VCPFISQLINSFVVIDLIYVLGELIFNYPTDEVRSRTTKCIQAGGLKASGRIVGGETIKNLSIHGYLEIYGRHERPRFIGKMSGTVLVHPLLKTPPKSDLMGVIGRAVFTAPSVTLIRVIP
jgi:hypothetical protein